MFVIKNEKRYEILAKEFTFPSDKVAYYSIEIKNSLDRILAYVFNYTDIFYIRSIDENLLCDYIKHHSKNNFNQVSFDEVLKDTKNFLYFSKYIKGIKSVPKMNLSVSNFSLWTQL
ncbi:hypothetical protein [Niallia sp. Krafla_26]|uniref:hypothetical protein n=1 Tax=Niallia sp. Krafla_26 TaxID=3064703 RepID=UPI003D17C31C